MAIIVPIGVDTKGLQRGLTGARGQLARFGKIAAVAAGAAALGGLVKTIQIGTEEFMEQQKVAAQTGAVLKSTGGIAKVTADEISTLAESLMRKSGVDDEAIQSGQNLLLTFTKIRNEQGKGNDIFNQATRSMLDLSVAMGKDLNSSAILVGKALNDPVRGATALSRAGVQLTEGQREQIKAFVESGRVMDAQKIILRELETQFGGSAAAAGKTLPGQLNILRQTFSNLAGELVARFMPAVASAATRLVEFLTEFSEQPTLRAKVQFLVDTFAGIAWRGLSTIYQWWNRETATLELPARVKIVPPGGRQIVESFVVDLRPNMNEIGSRLGDALADRFSMSFGDRGPGGISRELGLLFGLVKATVTSAGLNIGLQIAIDTARGFARAILNRILGGLRRAFDKAREVASEAVTLAQTVGFDFIQAFRNIIFDAIGNVIRDSLNRAWESVKSLASDIGDRIASAVTPRGRSAKRIKDVITAAVRDAVQSARRTLQSLGGEILGFLSDIRSASIRSPGGMLPADILKEQRRLEDARLKTEEDRLRAALETAEDKTQAQLDLDEFLLNKEITLRDRSIADQQATDKQAVDSLVDRFNQGLISADQFYAELQGIIGPAQGDALGAGMGSAFVNSFKLAVEEIKKVVADIFAVVGLGETIAATPGLGAVGQALQSENQRRFDEAMDAWTKERDRIQQRLDNRRERAKRKDSPQGEKISPGEKKEIDDLIAELNRHRAKKPQRAAYGLAMGGILKKTVFAAGEAGPEAVIPLESPSAMSMLSEALNAGGSRRGGGGDIYLTVNAGLGTNPDELSRVIVDSIKRYERRNGQVFQGPVVQSTATASGVVSTASGATDFTFLRSARRG